MVSTLAWLPVKLTTSDRLSEPQMQVKLKFSDRLTDSDFDKTVRQTENKLQYPSNGQTVDKDIQDKADKYSSPLRQNQNRKPDGQKGV